MVLSFPLSLPNLADLLPMQTVTWVPAYQQEMSGLGSGELLASDLGPPLWEAAVALVPQPHTQARAIKARIEALDGSLETFYLYDCLNAYPTHDPGGRILGARAVTVASVGADNKTLTLAGLPPWYQLENDMLAIDYGSPSRRALFRMIGSASASSGGVSAAFEVRPHIRPGIAVGNAVYLSKPSAKMVMVPGSLGYEQVAANRTRISFRARQTFRAG